MSALTQMNDIPIETLVDVPRQWKLKVQVDPRGPDTTDFYLNKEDHTLVNLLRMELHKNENVKFAAYRVPHPTQHQAILKIQTAPSGREGGEVVPSPEDALRAAVKSCLAVVDDFETKLREAAAAAYIQ